MRTQLQLPIPDYYDLSMTCHSHGWKNLNPFEWNDTDQSLSYATYLEDIPVDIKVRQFDGQIHVDIDSLGQLAESLEREAREVVTRSLSLDVDTSDLLQISDRVGDDYAEIIKKGAGRLLRSSTLWEDAAKTLFTTNCTWALTKQMCNAVCSDRFSNQTPSGIYPFPGPGVIARFSADQIQDLMPIGYRAEYLIGLAKLFVEDPTLQGIESKKFSYKEADKLVRGIRGFGDYATAHLLIMSGYFNEVPVDTVVVAYLKENHRVRKPHSFINRTYRKWGEYKWWGLKLEKIIRHQNWLGG